VEVALDTAKQILNTYLHVQDGGRTDPLPVTATFWEELAGGSHPQLDQGRLMSAFTFSEAWATWERHPGGEELVMLISGEATVLLEESDGERSVQLREPGAYVLVPRNVWHTARTTVPTTMLFLTPGAATEHKAAG